MNSSAGQPVKFPDVGSVSAWRARIQFRDAHGDLVAMADGPLQRSLHGVREVFQHCLVSAMATMESSQDAGGNDLAVGYMAITTGDYALWFDIFDRRRRFKRWLTTKESWDAAVDAVLRAASSELMALLRGMSMAMSSNTEGLMIRPVSGPEGVQSRVELSVPGQQPARLSSALWEWCSDPLGSNAVRDMFAVLLAQDVASVDVLLYPGTEHELRVRLDASPSFVEFVRGENPTSGARP